MWGRTRVSVAVGWALVVCACPGTPRLSEAADELPVRTLAQQILAATGVKGGLVVHVGCGDGKLCAALRANDSYLVHGLAGDPADIEAARAHIRSVGVYGRVSVEPWQGPRLPYADNLVNLVVAEGLGNMPMGEVMRVLCPNGVAYIKRDGQWTKRVKARPGDIDEWTHAMHGPDGNAVANDRVVGPPRHLQWVGAPRWARSHDHLASVSVVVSSGGRLFYIVDEGPTAAVALPAQWSLVARDAFNGVVLWKKRVRPWEGHLRGFRSGPPELRRRLVAIGDRVYVTLGYGQPVCALDAATGALVKTYEGTDGTLEIVYHDGLLYLVAGDPGADAAGAAAKRRGAVPPARNRRLLAVRADTGTLVWRKADAQTSKLMPLTLAVARARVLFHNADALVCLDANTGDEQWRTPRVTDLSRRGWSTPTLVVHDDVVLVADHAVPAKRRQASGPDKRVTWTPTSAGGGLPGELVAYALTTGKELWRCPCCETYNAPVDVLVTDGLVWTGKLVSSRDPGITEARDPRTGEIKRRRPSDRRFFRVGMVHHRCYRNKATSRYLLLGRAGIEFVDVATGKATAHHWVRGVCQYGVLPCNGLVYAPPHACACYIEAKLNGFNALASRRASAPPPRADRLERGPAFGQPVAASGTQEDWPTYRRDAARSGCTTSPVTADLEPVWQTRLAGRLSSLVVADGKVFVASVDTHTVHALDAKHGKPVWAYCTGGRVDSPPTIHKGLAVFGSADGWVYCVRAADGKLIWRFHAAPEDRHVVSYGQVESVWPVHGNVLVLDDVAYFAAGRSSFLDGGISLYRVDVRTGRKLSQTRLSSRDPKTGAEPQATIAGFTMPGALPDVLSSDGTSVYMRHRRFDRDGVEQKPNVAHLFCAAGFLDDTWWHRTYWQFGTKMFAGWGAWPRAGNQTPAGRILVCDASRVYGFGRANQYAKHGSHVGLGRTHYVLFASDKEPKVIKTELPPRRRKKAAPTRRRPATKIVAPRADAKGAKAKAPGAAKAVKKQRRPRRRFRYEIELRWSERPGMLVRAMVLAGTTLFIAGPSKPPAPSGTPGAWQGKHGALLRAVSSADGTKLAERRLPSVPVFDGMAAANARLFIATCDGTVLCMGKTR